MSNSLMFKLKIFGEITFTIILGLVIGNYIYSFTGDVFWTVLTNVVLGLILINVILLQFYSYLYFTSSFSISIFIVASMLVFKIINNNSNDSDSYFFRENIGLSSAFMWLLFIGSILTILSLITKYIVSQILKNKVSPKIGKKGKKGNQGNKGGAYQLKNGGSDDESEYVLKSLINYGDKKFKSVKNILYNEYKTKYPNGDMPHYLIFNDNEFQLKNVFFIEHLEKICYSKDFKELLNKITNDVLNKQEPIIQFSECDFIDILELETLLNLPEYKDNQLKFLRDKLNRPCLINQKIKIVLNNNESITLNPDNYIYNDYCFSGDNQKKEEGVINIYNFIKDYYKGCYDTSLKIKLEIIEEGEDFLIARNNALCKTTEYLKNYLDNWIDLITKDKNGIIFLNSELRFMDMIEPVKEILSDDSIFMLFFLKDKDGLNSIQKITENETFLNRDYLQTDFMVTKNIDFTIITEDNVQDYTFIDTNMYCKNKKLQKFNNCKNTEKKKSTEGGMIPIERNMQINKIEIKSKSNTKNVWNWGNSNTDCN